MIITVVALLVIASVPLTGGSLERMSQVRFVGVWLVLASLGIQLAITTVFVDAPYPVLLAAAHLASYALAAAFLWRNRAVPGLLVIAAGGIANFAAIAANGGVMPASAPALEMAGMTIGSGFENSAVVEGARLQMLGDVFAIPDGWPLSNVFSVGDVVLLVGVGILVHRVGRWPAVEEAPVIRPQPVEDQPAAAQSCCAMTRPHRCCTGARRGQLVSTS